MHRHLRVLVLPVAALAMGLPPVAAAQAPAVALVPDPERAVDTPVGTRGPLLQVGFDPKKVLARVQADGGRIISAETKRIDNGSKPDRLLHVVGYAANRGVMARRWWWDPSATRAVLLARAKARNARIIDLHVFPGVDGKRRYSAVSVANTGPAKKSWSWRTDLDSDEVEAVARKAGERIVDLERFVDDRYEFLAIKDTGVDARRWKVVRAGPGLESEMRSSFMRVQDLEADRAVLVQTERQPGEPSGQLIALGGRLRGDTERTTRLFGGRPAVLEVVRPDAPAASTNAIGLEHALVSDVTRATEDLRGSVVFGQSPILGKDAATTDKLGMLLTRPGGTPLVALSTKVQHETASALKTLHHAAVTRAYEVQGLPLDKADDFLYRDMSGGPSCPTERGAPRVPGSLAQTAAAMLQNSDNGATEAMLDRAGGPDGLRSYARTLGLTSVQLGAPLGCFSRSRPNLWHLEDAARLYAAILGTAVAKTPKYREHLIGSLRNDGAEAARTRFAELAQAAGKPSAAALAAQIDRRTKAGGYDFGQTRIRTDDGFLVLPRMEGGQPKRRAYYFGVFFDSDRGTVPGAVAGITTAMTELAIADALATFPAG